MNSKATRTTSLRGSRALRLGIFGGTFDPVHHGHLVLAHDALEQARLDAVLFVPCAQSPHKNAQPLSSDRQRLAMLRRALKGEPRFWLSPCELGRPGPSYAIDTADEIAQAFPHAHLLWLIGEDQLARLREWHRWPELRRKVEFLLLRRTTEKALPTAPRLLRLPHPRRMDISATEIRHRVKSRLPIAQLVPAAVAAYIQRQGLYL